MWRYLYLRHPRIQDLSNLLRTKALPSRNRVIISIHVRSATHVRSRSGYTTAILDRGKAAQVPIPTMGKRNERLGKRNHGNYWISWMIRSSVVGLCWYPPYAWSNPAYYSQSDTGMSVTTHKVSITLLRWRPVPWFDYGVSMRTLENSSCLCGSSGIDELCWSTRLPDSMDKRKHGPLTPTEYGVVLRTLAAYQSFFMLSPSNRTLIITTPYYGVLS